ncbi:hypothetical protein DERP_005711 [Dermatophagoides pteronyssinus]|uniref:Uncharacterized protein n=1 Tax=Dermatophagoides pteronyssinus TaxID=6956 RepID=A0ABQ8J9D4_DERPT|nr:hypothetical protein DERP_005711 [Dermatophagoides pteronyssinus]
MIIFKLTKLETFSGEFGEPRRGFDLFFLLLSCLVFPTLHSNIDDRIGRSVSFSTGIVFISHDENLTVGDG